MPLNTQADIFISILAELAAAERERQADRLRLRDKANADRFMRAFPDRIRRSNSSFGMEISQPEDPAVSRDDTNEPAISLC